MKRTMTTAETFTTMTKADKQKLTRSLLRTYEAHSAAEQTCVAFCYKKEWYYFLCDKLMPRWCNVERESSKKGGKVKVQLRLRNKHMEGMPPSEEELNKFDQLRSAVVENELCKGFLESRQLLDDMLSVVNQYLCLAIEKGAAPSDEEVADAMSQQMSACSCGGGCHGDCSDCSNDSCGKKSCNCGPDCTCGCQEGKECTCGDGCNCGSDCTCGCQEGKECTCGDDCCGKHGEGHECQCGKH